MNRFPSLIMLLSFLALGVPDGLAAPPGGPPAQPDLDVTYISITPRPPSYYPNYSAGFGRPTDPNTNQVISIEAAQAIKHYHAPGDIVTFTAHLVNHGGVSTAPYAWAFKVDGATIASGREETGLAADASASVTGQTYTLKGFNGNPNGYTYRTVGLTPGAWKNFTAQWAWQDGPHKVRFEVMPDASSATEISTRNNAREDWTDAQAFFITVKKGTQGVVGGSPQPTGYNGFRGTRNFTDPPGGAYPEGYGSYSFEDWLQYHVDLMHDKFAKSIYPTAPNGILEHIRIDEILILDDAEGVNGPGEYRAVNGFDSSWPFDTYPASLASTRDWGLIHEWGHQLGLIDIYNMDQIPSENFMLDIDGYPTGLGREANQGGMMRGHGDTVFSEFDAIGMNTQLGRRRGWYGDFQYLMPARNRVRVLDNAGQPVANAEISVHQGKPVSAAPVFTGTTDAEGYWDIPNRPVTEHTTEYKPGAPTVYTERANPFGQIDVVGNRALLWFRVRSGDKREFFDLDTTDFVRAWASQGKDLATFVFNTRFASAASPAPPANLKARLTSGTGSSLTWDASPSTDVTAYKVYKGVEARYEWELVATVGSGTTSYADAISPRQMVRYAVTAVTATGESQFSNEVGLYAFGDMRGIVEQPSGTILVADYPREQPILLRPDFSPISIFGSVHNHVAAIDVTVSRNNWVPYIGFPGSYEGDGKAGLFQITADGSNRISYVFRPYGSGPGQWRLPEGIAPENNGGLIVTDSQNHRVEVTDAYGYGTQLTFGESDLLQPVKTIQLPDGNFLTTDRQQGKVVLFSSVGAKIGDVASLPGASYIARGSDGTLAVSQPSANKVALLNADLTPRSDITASPDGAVLSNPRGVAFTTAGDLLIADAGNRRMVRVSVIIGPVWGDVDGNGRFEQADVTLALRIAGGLVESTKDQLLRGDVVKGPNLLTDTIDIRDAAALQKARVAATTD